MRALNLTGSHSAAGHPQLKILPALVAGLLVVAPINHLAASPALPAASAAPSLQVTARQVPAPVTGSPTSEVAPTAAAETTLIPDATRSVRRFTFRQLGAKTPLELRGVQGYYTLPFAVRADEVVSKATLRLEYTWSPSLLEDLSHINVRINDEVAATLPLPRARAGEVVRTDVNIAPQLITEFSRIALELVAHYDRGCEDPAHSGLWASVSNTSALELQVTRARRADDLSALPQPFFDRRDTAALTMPMVFAAPPDLAALTGAGTISSWFGSLAGYRGVRFNSMVGQLPAAGNAVVMGVGNDALRTLGIVAPTAGTLQGPTVAMVAHPRDATAKLLLVLGRDTAELRTAAAALATGGSTFSGQSVTVNQLTTLRPRKPYDAPNWLPSDRSIRFGELTAPDVLGVAGMSPDLIRVGFQLPPDLFGWRSKGIPIDLKYRYSPRPAADKSSLNINVNQRFLRSVPLHSPSGDGWGSQLARAVPDSVAKKLPDIDEAVANERLFVPLFMLPAQNELQLHYFYEKPKLNTCQTAALDNVRGSVDPDSTLDISGFPHYLAMPDLAAFGNSGFPFTRMADLSETAVVLPDAPAAADVDTYLALMGRMGAATGYPAHAATLTRAATIDQFAHKDLLIIGSGPSQPLLDKWAAYMPVTLQGAAKKVTLSDAVYRMAAGNLDRRAGIKPADSMVEFEGNGSDGMIVGFESPLAKNRSVVVVYSNQPDSASHVVDVLLDAEMLKHVQGSATLVRGSRVESLVAEQGYYVGELPLITRLHWFFSRHPMLMALATMAGMALLAGVLFGLLRDRARRRLRNA